jgi:hypothetical protein
MQAALVVGPLCGPIPTAATTQAPYSSNRRRHFMAYHSDALVGHEVGVMEAYEGCTTFLSVVDTLKANDVNVVGLHTLPREFFLQCKEEQVKQLNF